MDRPAASNSFSPTGSEAEVLTIAPARLAGTKWITNSRFSRIFRAVSLAIAGWPSRAGILLPGAKATRGGLEPKTLKKEKGAALTRPRPSMVVTQAMGRGVTKEARTL